MSAENVESVRCLYASFSRADDSFFDLVTPDFAVDFSRRLADPFVVSGAERALDMFRHGVSETWQEWPTWEPDELIEVGDRVLAFVRFGARGRSSGVEVEVLVANLWTFRDGRAAGLEYFGEDRAAALEAAGLPGE